MSRFLSSRMDLADLQAIEPELIQEIDYEAIRSARLDDLQARLPTVDVLSTETDPMVKLQEADAYREALDLGLLNDTYRGTLPAFALGSDLDQRVATSGIARLAGEDDDTLRMRYFASFGVPAAGSEDAYVFHALSAHPGAQDIRINGPGVTGEPGRVDVVVLAPGGTAPSGPVISAVVEAVNGKSARPITDWVHVLAATVVPYAIEMTVRIRRGPDPTAARNAVIASAESLGAKRYRVGGQVPVAAVAACGYENGAVTVTVTSPTADIAPDPYKAPFCTGISVTVQVID